MIVAKIDNDFQALLKAQVALEQYGDKEGTIKVTSPLPLLRHIEVRRLSQEVKELQELEIRDADILLLESTNLFTPSFLQWFKDTPLPKVSVKINDGKLEIIAKGTLAELTLLEIPLLALITEHYYNVAIAQLNITEELVLSESIRRLQVKADVLREYQDIKIVVGGTKNRFSFEWQNMMMTMLIGEFGDKIVGVTNPIMSMAYGLSLKGYLNSDMWVDGWPLKDIYPSYPAPSGWSGAKYDFDNMAAFTSAIESVDKDFEFILTDLTAFDIAHLQSHITRPNIIFEFENYITNDIPIRNPEFTVERKISTKNKKA